MGQEIIYEDLNEEIEELKGLTIQLSKKTWLQLLRVKLVDLTLSQLINKELAGYVWKTFSEEGLKWLDGK